MKLPFGGIALGVALLATLMAIAVAAMQPAVAFMAAAGEQSADEVWHLNR